MGLGHHRDRRNNAKVPATQSRGKVPRLRGEVGNKGLQPQGSGWPRKHLPQETPRRTLRAQPASSA
jgi:hypothetical protein